MRDYEDIPEPFRRALEEVGWGSGNDDGDDEPPQRPPSNRRPWWTNRGLWITAVILGFLLSFNWIVTTYTDWLWFTGLDYAEAWLQQWGFRVGSFVIFFVLAGVVLLTNWHIARRRAVRQGVSPQALRLPGLGWIITAFALFLSFIFGQAGATQWDGFLRFLYRVPFGTADPIFGRDVSFYLFELPVFRFLQGWILFLLVIALIGTVLLYLAGNAKITGGGRLEVGQTVPGLRQHLAVLGVLALVTWAVGYQLNLWELVYSPRGVVFGASYTDLQAQRPALYIQLVLMLVVALAVGVNIFRANVRIPAVAAGLWVVATIGIAGIYPSVLQRYSVEPNELLRESPYIAHNIEFTRLAFGLEDADKQPFAIGADLTSQDLEDEVSLANVRVWDYRPLRATYSQLQGLRPYYQFNEIDIDRYEIDGQVRQVMLAARELDKARLPSRTWVNESLIFTHGYGVVMNPVDQVTRDGQPRFFIQDLPPRSSVDVQVTRPEIYYGELDNSIVFVGSRQAEFNYPSGDRNVETTYEGTGGIPISNYLRRLAFAVRFAETNLLLSDDVTTETRILFRRNIVERVRTVTPFLEFDDDPYIVIHEGRLVWMMDGYTISRDFPYSEPVGTGGINYIRNAVKVTVDAYDGNVTYYVADEEDPIIRTYQRAFPSLFQPLSAMPEGLQRHLRYPEDLFLLQTQQYLTYHMTEVSVFYNQEDLWEIPEEKLSDGSGAQDNLVKMEPYYVMLTLPGEESPEYLLIQPYVPSGKDNMIAWISARNDPPNYGELVVFELPKQELVFGPSQIEARIDQDTDISQQISLWNQQGSEVIRGNLIVIPIDNNFLYVEPLYLQAESSALPELKRVIVATGDRIAMRENLADALTALLLDDEPNIIVEVEPETTEPPPDEGTAPPPIVGDRTLEQLINAANDHFLAAEEAQRNGDWTAYGEELEALRQTLAELEALTAPSTEGQ